MRTLRRREGLSSSPSKAKSSASANPASSSVVCDICGKNVNKHYLSRHMVTHTGEKNFECDECGVSETETFFMTEWRSRTRNKTSASVSSR